MSILKRNIVANLLGNGWSAVLSIIFIPLYIHFMGIESYALIGIYTTLASISSILDLGMSTTINREMARLSPLPDKEQEMVDLFRTMEIISWAIAIFVGLLILLLAHPISYHWVKPGKLAAETVRKAICLMGISMIFQWPFNFYSGGLIGLQRQVLLNIIIAGMATLRSIGAIFVLWLISPSIQAFLVWNIIINALQFFTLAICLKTKLPSTVKLAAFQWDLIYSIWRFAAGMGAISILSTMLSQIDKFILSRLLTLEMFGYYTLASVVATSFSRLMGPLVNAIFPRFTELIALGETDKLKQLYHSGCQIMSVMIMPIALLMFFFSKDILLLWTRNPVTAERTFTLVAFLAIGTMFNGLAHLPLSLEYAFGRTRTVFYANLLTVIIMLPSIYLATQQFGVIGACVVLMIINVLFTLSLTFIICRHLLADEKKDWYVKDTGVPLLVTIIVMGMGRILVPDGMSASWLVSSLTAITILTVCSTAYSAPAIRNWFLGYMANSPQ